MRRNRFIAHLGLILTLMFVLATSRRSHGQDSKSLYPGMAPLEQYLMDRDAEIDLARSAAPDSISHDATVAVLGRHGYETAVQGKNGFVCVVERGWMDGFDDPEFWNPKQRGPICYNPEAARSVLPITYLRTKLALSGSSKDEIRDGIKQAYAKKELPLLEPGAMSFMMAKHAHITDKKLTEDGAHNIAHLMFYTPVINSADWGANLDKSPVYLNPVFRDPEPMEVFVVLTGMWSDGTPAPLQ
jgi:hypothetical protein